MKKFNFTKTTFKKAMAGMLTVTMAVSCVSFSPVLEKTLKDAIYAQTSGSGLTTGTINFEPDSEITPGDGEITPGDGEFISYVELDEEEVTIKVGDVYNVGFTYEPEDASIDMLDCVVDDSDVAEAYIDYSDELEKNVVVINGIGQGSATIDLMLENEILASICVEVEPLFAVDDVCVDKELVKVYENGKSVRVYYDIFSESEDICPEDLIYWESDDSDVADVEWAYDEEEERYFVDIYGYQVGTANITLSIADEEWAYVEVKVVKKQILPTKVTLNKTTKKLEKGKQFTLTAIVGPKNATNKKVTWSTSNKKVATVTSRGVVKGVAPGKATIKVKTVNGKTASCKVTVFKKPVVKLSKTKATISVGKTVQIKIKDKYPKKDRVKAYISGKKSVATVSNKGLVKGIKPGVAKITVVMKSGAKAVFTVTVKKK